MICPVPTSRSPRSSSLPLGSLLWGSLLWASLLTACAGRAAGPAASVVTADAPAPAPADATTSARRLIPRRVLFGNPERTNPSLSPDGSQLSFLAPVDGVLNVWVGPVDDLAAARPITHDTGRGIFMADWTWGGDRVVYVQDRGGDENWHLYAVELATGESRDLTPLDGVAAQLLKASPARPDALLVALNDRDPRYHDVHRVELATGARTLVMKNEQGFAGYIASDALEVRVAVESRDDGGTEYFVRKGKRWVSSLVIGRDDAISSNALGLDAAGTTLYLGDSRGRETAALIAYDLAKGTSKVLAEDPRVDVGTIIADIRTGRPLAVSFDHLRRRWQALDPSVTADLEALRAVTGDDFEVLEQTRDGRQWLVVGFDDDGPARYYRYDRDAGTVSLLLVDQPALEEQPLVPMHPLVIESRDGLPLVSYLSLPKGSDPDGDGRPSEAVPMVLLVHGGPWGRDHWGLHPEHQWLADRGYAVLSVNFRGSTGFTKSFVNAADHEWAGKMHDDLLDAVRWAVDEGIARRDRVAIMGTSYGGYATLVGLTFTPEVFACGVDVVGPSNLVTLLESIPPYWESLRSMFMQRIGDVDTEEGQALLRERSPLTRVDAITRPLLIGQGANDPRVKQAEADQIVEAMTKRGIPVTYVLYPDEGHGFHRPQNVGSFNAITEAFLAQCLGGAHEPFDDAFEGSSLTVPVGAEHVPGLVEALRAHEGSHE
ncbi:MAG: S9 family peptidase [Myxococcales bacterium]|nr:S9 family peptidase [Myxococcales bacterium]